MLVGQQRRKGIITIYWASDMNGKRVLKVAHASILQSQTTELPTSYLALLRICMTLWREAYGILIRNLYVELVIHFLLDSICKIDILIIYVVQLLQQLHSLWHFTNCYKGNLLTFRQRWSWYVWWLQMALHICSEYMQQLLLKKLMSTYRRPSVARRLHLSWLCCDGSNR